MGRSKGGRGEEKDDRDGRCGKDDRCGKDERDKREGGARRRLWVVISLNVYQSIFLMHGCPRSFRASRGLFLSLS